MTSVTDEVRRIADTIMYEGYVLYPYRASAAKNRSRWQFGVLMPPAYLPTDSCERSAMTAECLLEPRLQGDSGPVTVEVTARFLQVQRRTGADVWDEAVDQEITVTAAGGSVDPVPFVIPGGTERSEDGVTRTRQDLRGRVTVRMTELPGPWGAARLTVTLANETVPDVPEFERREEALPFALVAAHLVITVSGGAFLSLTDPPEWASGFAGECESEGCWPALAGPAGSGSTVLASPVILPDYPEVAPESAGELYDGTEIDEILTLRTLALTDAEKEEARATDPRAAALIDRVEAVAADSGAMGRLHGTWRPLPSPASGVPGFPDAAGVPAGAPGFSDASGVPGASGSADSDVPWWDPEADGSVSPSTDSVVVDGQDLAAGSRVRLRPGARRADAQDMFLTGREAVIEAVLHDVDDAAYLAVSLVDDPGADIRSAHGRFLYFTPDEVEPC